MIGVIGLVMLRNPTYGHGSKIGIGIGLLVVVEGNVDYTVQPRVA